MVSENDNHKPPVVLDERRGMAAQKATDSRRRESKVQADQELLRPGQPELEKNLFVGPAKSWEEAADKAAI